MIQPIAEIIGRLDGDQTRGRGAGFWMTAAIGLVAAGIYGAGAGSFTVDNAAYMMTWVFMALGLSLMWGFGGILSFGQAAFFGIGGYVYGILTINWGGDLGLPLAAMLIGVAAAALVAGILGYFLFYGGVADVFVGITTLAVSLALEAFMAQTAGPQWRIGQAALGGFNGLSGVEPLALPWFGGSIILEQRALFFVVLGLIVFVYLALRLLLNGRFGDALVAIRENPVRAQALGINVPFRLTVTFVIGSSLAGLSGVLYTAWGQYITPDTMGLNAAVLPIIWVAVSGRGDLTATAIGTLVLIALSQQLAVNGSQFALIALGAILVASTFLCPRGLLLTPVLWLVKAAQGRRAAGLGDAVGLSPHEARSGSGSP